MECPIGCISESTCDSNDTFIITAMFLAFIGFCGGQMCYIVSLRRKLDRVLGIDESNQDSTLVQEIPPPYQQVENI